MIIVQSDKWISILNLKHTSHFPSCWMWKQHCWKYKSADKIESRWPFWVEFAYFSALSNSSYMTLKVNCVGIAVKQIITLNLCGMKTFRQCCLVALMERVRFSMHTWVKWAVSQIYVATDIIDDDWFYMSFWWGGGLIILSFMNVTIKYSHIVYLLCSWLPSPKGVSIRC